jgi:hypothetical protein
MAILIGKMMIKLKRITITELRQVSWVKHGSKNLKEEG